MKMKFGALVVDGRNKIGGHVASKNRAGAYLRTKVTPTNPGTTYQVIVRNRLAGLSSAWRALTGDERTAWNAAVADFAKTDIFGDLRHPSGFNLHQMLNNNLLKINQNVITTPPLPQAVEAFSSLSIAAAFAVPSLVLTFAPAITANFFVYISATPGISPGISFVKSEYRRITFVDVGGVSPLDVKDAYVSKFGAIPAVGTKIFVRMVQIHKTTGQEGLPIQASGIVA
jgi:hypothetical protein